MHENYNSDLHEMRRRGKTDMTQVRGKTSLWQNTPQMIGLKTKTPNHNTLMVERI